MLGLKLLKMMLVSSVLALCFYTPANADVSVSVGPGGAGLYVGSSYARPVVAAPVVVSPPVVVTPAPYVGMPPPPSRYYYRPYRGYHYAPPPPPPHHHHHHHHHGPHHGHHDY